MASWRKYKAARAQAAATAAQAAATAASGGGAASAGSSGAVVAGQPQPAPLSSAWRLAAAAGSYLHSLRQRLWGSSSSEAAVQAVDATAAAAAAAEVASRSHDASPGRLASRGAYMIDTTVAKGTHHDYANPCSKRNPAAHTLHVHSPQAQALVAKEQLPAAYDIRNIGGVNYASLDRNQLIIACISPLLAMPPLTQHSGGQGAEVLAR